MSDHHPMSGHDYDGIQEEDNQLPRWWVWLFIITIIIAFLYLMWFHVLGLGQGQIGLYRDAVAQAEAAQAARQAQALANLDLTRPSTESAVLSEGGSLYQTHCSGCHLASGAGLIGPNLTDAYWIHGAAFADNMRIIENGVLEKGMTAWKNSLSLRQRHAVASYIYTLRGSNPPNPRDPQGTEVPTSNSPTYQLN